MKDRKRQVIAAAKELFIKKGVIATSVQDIIDESQISKGTFYNYFPSKNACLIAILEQGNEDTYLRRKEIISGQDVSDKHILAKQIAVHLLVHREHNLIPIFQAIHYSGDQDLKKAVKRHQLEELAWLTARLIDIYGKESTSAASDCAVMLYGIIQHLMHIGRNWSTKDVEPTKVIDFALRRIDAMMVDMVNSHDTFLEQDVFIKAHVHKQVYTKQELVTQLETFSHTVKTETNSDDHQLTQFMIDEIQTNSPRIAIIEAVNRSLRETYTNTALEHQAKELSATIWRYIDRLKQ